MSANMEQYLMITLFFNEPQKVHTLQRLFEGLDFELKNNDTVLLRGITKYGEPKSSFLELRAEGLRIIIPLSSLAFYRWEELNESDAN